MPRIYVEIPDPPFREAARRALAERRSTREQIAYDIERLYAPAVVKRPEHERQVAEAPR